MSGRTLIGGTAYEIVDGTTKVGGTLYSITEGRTKIGGSVYSIDFGPVPYAYQQVEYIQYTSSTIAYYTLPITSQEGLKLECKLWSVNYNDYQCHIGTITSSSLTSKARQFFHIALDEDNYDYGVASCAGDSVTSGLPLDSSGNIGVNFGNYGTTNTIVLTYNSNNRTSSVNRTRTLSSTGNTMYIMNPNSVRNGKYGSIKAYNASNTLIMELYPVYRKSDNAPGFWDSISRQFLSKSGSGAVTVGPDV